MSGTNIFMVVISAVGPVIGEGLKEGFQGSIELDSFSWDMSITKDPSAKTLSLGNLAASAKGLLGIGGLDRVKLGALSITKKFDIASPVLHTYLDNHVLILSLAITVLHIKPKGRAIHQPGFVLTMENGYFASSNLDMAGSGPTAELKETMKFNGDFISISYLKSLGKDNAPTNPFFFKK